MTKDEIKLLCEDDDKLCWWAMVLFAEMCEIASLGSGYRNDDQAIASYARSKADEFPRLVIQRSLEKAKEKQGPVEESP